MNWKKKEKNLKHFTVTNLTLSTKFTTNKNLFLTDKAKGKLFTLTDKPKGKLFTQHIHVEQKK